jgi:hypothetical protein
MYEGSSGQIWWLPDFVQISLNLSTRELIIFGHTPNSEHFPMKNSKNYFVFPKKEEILNLAVAHISTTPSEKDLVTKFNFQNISFSELTVEMCASPCFSHFLFKFYDF